MEMALTAGRRLSVLEMNIRNGVKQRLQDDRGEGVISMAIAILIVAALGAAMYVIFTKIGTDAGKKAEKQIEKIG